jgi:hypothetical protein
MADTYVKRIVAAIATLIDATGKPTGLVVSSSRKRSSNAAKHIAVFPLHDEAANENIPRSRAFMGARRILTVEIVCRCAGSDLENETIRSWIVAQLFKDVTLGGIAVGLDEGATDWQGEIDSQNDYSEALMQFVVEYSRPKNNLELVP